MITNYDKALAALVVGAVVLLATHFGLNLSPDMQAALTTLATTVAVYLIPNKA